jgi:mannosyltransferase
VATTNVDAEHGAYYLLMWPIVHGAAALLGSPIVDTFGTAEVVLRLPSLLVMTAAAAGVAALGRRLHSPRAGLLAGLVFAVLPEVSRYAQEGRSYAFVLACAVLASYLLVRALDEPGCAAGSPWPRRPVCPRCRWPCWPGSSANSSAFCSRPTPAPPAS